MTIILAIACGLGALLSLGLLCDPKRDTLSNLHFLTFTMFTSCAVVYLALAAAGN